MNPATQQPIANTEPAAILREISVTTLDRRRAITSVCAPESTVVVFDLYGVLARTQDPAGQRALEALLDVHHAPGDFWDSYWAERPAYDRGDVTAAEYWSRVGRRLDRTTLPNLTDQLIEADVESWSRIDQSMVDLAHQMWAQHRQLVLLSNAPIEIAARIRDQQAWLNLFTAVVFSCDIGAAKPEPAAFEAVEAALGSPRELLMVDDRTENITAARKRGWAGLQFTDQTSLAFTLGIDIGQC